MPPFASISRIQSCHWGWCYLQDCSAAIPIRKGIRRDWRDRVCSPSSVPSTGRLDWISTDISEEQQVLGHGLQCSSVGTAGSRAGKAHHHKSQTSAPWKLRRSLCPPAPGSSFPEESCRQGYTSFVVGASDQQGNKSHGRSPGHLCKVLRLAGLFTAF